MWKDLEYIMLNELREDKFTQDGLSHMLAICKNNDGVNSESPKTLEEKNIRILSILIGTE